MREIKFRAWDTMRRGQPLKEMVYFGITRLDGEYIIASGSYLEGDYKLMQYTGLKDKNGKEIYEGDVVETNRPLHAWEYPKNSVRVIFFEEGAFYFKPPLHNLIYRLHTNNIKNHNMKVIGNIYENKELLEEKYGQKNNL